MTKLNEVQIKLTEQLLIVIAKKEMNVTYKELANRISPPIHWRNVGYNIGEISKLCRELNLPLLSVKVVNANSDQAGEGFYALYKELYGHTEQMTEKELFKREMKCVRECEEWGKLAKHLDLEIEGIGNYDSINSKQIRKLPIKSYSWTILSDKVFVKRVDKSVFKHNGSGIPKDIRTFFSLEKIKDDERIQIRLKYKNIIYTGRFEIDKIDEPRTRIFWETSLTKQLITSLPNWESIIENEISTPILRLEREENQAQLYDVELIIPENINEDSAIEEIYDSGQFAIREGNAKFHYVKTYERNPESRIKAIEFHGTKCVCCGFDFSEQYGKHGEGYIEIHHLKPLSNLGKEVIVNPETDLVPVCANCHRMIHRRKDHVLSIEELTGMIKKANISDIH